MGKKLEKLQQVHNYHLSKRNVGYALIDSKFAEMGTEVEIEIRNKQLKAVTVAKPFYKRTK